MLISTGLIKQTTLQYLLHLIGTTSWRCSVTSMQEYFNKHSSEILSMPLTKNSLGPINGYKSACSDSALACFYSMLKIYTKQWSCWRWWCLWVQLSMSLWPCPLKVNKTSNVELSSVYSYYSCSHWITYQNWVCSQLNRSLICALIFLSCMLQCSCHKIFCCFCCWKCIFLYSI